MYVRHVRRAALTAGLLTTALLLTACGGEDTAASGGASASTGSPAAGSPSAPQAEQGSGTSGSGSPEKAGTPAPEGSAERGAAPGSGKKAAMCRTDELEAAAEDNSTGGKESVVTVSFTNRGGRDCGVNGYAGADLRTADGSTISVDRSGRAARAEVLGDGETAAFNLYFPVNDSGGSGVRVTDLIVTPPGETKHITLAWPAGSLPVTDGSGTGTKLRIDPVGKVSDSPAG